MKIKNENKKVKDMGILLFADSENNPLKRYLNVKRLDFSIESLRDVDKYLEKVRKNKLSEEEIKKVILRCGTYLGEAIRKRDLKEFIWVSYETACNLSKDISLYERNLLTHLILFDIIKKRFWFPLNKVYKFIEYGKSENLLAFAKVCLSGVDQNEK